MSEYIERGAAKALFNDIPPFVGMTGKCVQDMLDKVQAADVVEVKHGRWLYKRCVVFDCTKDLYRCSECNTSWDAKSHYCPNCGAKMDGE